MEAKKVILLFIINFSFFVLFAQSPQSFKYQAVARDAGGDALQNQDVGIQISILQGSADGASVYTETHYATTNEFGLLNLEIGNGNPVSGNFSLIDWGSDSYFIKIEMDVNGGTSYQHIGTSQMLSVPYALFAQKSGDGSQWIQNANNIYYNNGNVGIGTNNPTNLLQLNLNESGAGLFNGLQINRGDAFLRFVNGTDQVGTFQPRISAFSNSTIERSPGITIVGTANYVNSVTPHVLIRAGEFEPIQGGNIFQVDNYTTSVMTIDMNGNVGIGSTFPTSKLQVVGLPEYPDNTTALEAGLTPGAFYHTAGVLKVVY